MHDTPPPAASPSEREPFRAHRIAVIAAVARNGIIGVKNRLPWRLAEDMRRFRALTTGHAVVMAKVRGDDRKAEAVRILRDHGGHFINYYGRFATEEIVRWQGAEPAVSDLLKR